MRCRHRRSAKALFAMQCSTGRGRSSVNERPLIRSIRGSSQDTKRFPAIIPEGQHPIPSRTRKLSPPGPMVLQGRLCGRVGRRREIFARRAPPDDAGERAFLFYRHELDVEHEHAGGRAGTRGRVAVGEAPRDPEARLFAHDHELYALGPALDDAAERE